MHLVSRNFHQIANLHVNPKLHIEENSPKDLESLVQSSRTFEELQFSGECDENFEMIEEFIGSVGIHIKKLDISFLKMDHMIVQKLLNSLPNLEFLELNSVEITSEKTNKWNLKVTKIQRIKILGNARF